MAKRKLVNTKNTQQSPKKKICVKCRCEKLLTGFYMASNPLTSSDGERVNVCKDCVKKISYNPDGSLNIDKFRDILMILDKAYVPKALTEAIKEAQNVRSDGTNRPDVVGLYMKNVSSLKQYKNLSYKESIEKFDESIGVKDINTYGIAYRPEGAIGVENVYVRQLDAFEVTDEIVDLFGEGYKPSEYHKMKRKYDKLKQNYQLTTNLHEEALATYVRFKIKEEQATASGDVQSAEKWNKAATEAADKAKLTPKQLTQADLQGGITAISEISKAVEECVDIVEMLPRFKYAPNDAPDFIIWCYINFARKLRGLPEVEYADVYKFYDKKKEEYIQQYGDVYGIFTDDTSESNRSSVEQFIKLPKDYNMGGE